MTRYCWMPLLTLGLVGLAAAQDPPDLTRESLEGTELLLLESPLHEVMIREISAYAEAELSRAQDARFAAWLPQQGQPPRMTRDEALAQLRELIGAVDTAVERPVIFEKSVAFSEAASVMSLRWDVLEGVSGEALAVNAHITRRDAPPFLIFLGDADQSPEQLLGWDDTVPRESKLLQSLAPEYEVIVPRLVNRANYASGHPDIRWTNLSHREFVYRTSFEMGRHVIGYEVQRIMALARGLKAESPNRPVHILGVGEGGLLALYAAALSPQIDAVTVRGYFGMHRRGWEEPLDRNVWKGQLEFGNAELVSLILPRPVTIDPSPAPEVAGPPTPGPGMGDIAAPGQVQSPSQEDVLEEFTKASGYMALIGGDSKLILQETPVREELIKIPVPANLNVAQQIADRQRQIIGELVRHSQAILHRSDKQRDKYWSQADRSMLESWEKTSQAYRTRVHDDLIGRLPAANPSAMHPRSRKVIDKPSHVGYELTLDTYDRSGEASSFIAGGILLLPRNLKAGERRPVVVCQHGLEGVPMDTITTNPEDRAYAPYKGFSTALVERGFIVYAPQNPYKGYHDFRVIQRKSNPIGRSLFSYIIEQHRQTLHWLADLPFVDSERIAFYGLSYGGKTAVRVPPLLVDPTPDGGQKPLYCLSICSADYNEWIRKNCSAEDRYSYVFTPEYEIFEWNMGHVADYSELANLMTPRPFMVERGHGDGVAPDEWVAWEYAKVRRHYDLLGIGEATEIEFFNGPHTINGQGTYRFLEKHLNWPAR